MTNEEMDKAIAEFCGWKLEPLDGREFNGIPVMVWKRPDGEKGFPIPCYSVDLNAMHQVEKAFMSSIKADEYLKTLDNLVNSGIFCSAYNTVTASAFWRAQALLRTIGKWRDE